MDALTEVMTETRPSGPGATAQVYPVVLCGDAGERDRLPVPALLGAGLAIGNDGDGMDTEEGWLAAPVIVCSRSSASAVVDDLAARGITPHTVVAVPCAEGPARALTAAALLLIATDPEAIMLVCSGPVPDRNRVGMRETIGGAAAEAQRGTFVLFSSGSGDVGPESGLLMVAARRFLQEIELSAPKVLDACADAVALAVRKNTALYLARPSYEAAPSLSIDAAVMARGTGVAVFPLPGADERPDEPVGSTVERAFGAIPGTGMAPLAEEEEVSRPWGAFRTVDRGRRFQVKQIVVNPGGRLSLQMHHHRSEHWIVVAGTARVLCGEEERFLYENEHAFIRAGEKHRLENPGKVPLRVIEVQSGSYLGEDDIVRFDDIYGRGRP